MYYTYVLLSQKDKQFYIGWTDDLKMRIQKHNQVHVLATKCRMPLKLVYYEACIGEKDAIKREKALKSGFGRAYLKRRLTFF